MARRRDEMMQNAKLRDEQREANVKRYRADDAREEAEVTHAQKLRKGKGADFIKWVSLAQ